MDMQSTQSNNPWYEACFDLTRGLAAYATSPLIAGVAEVLAKHPDSDISVAFNHKQIGSKMWARDCLFDTLGGKFGRIVTLGGWYGVLGGVLLDDRRFDIREILNVDIDKDVEAVAQTLLKSFGDRFRTIIQDMYTLDYSKLEADLIINTSCEHIQDLPAWLLRVPKGQRVLLQSNDYFSEPTHINCVPSLEAFREQVKLAKVDFAGELKMKKYTRFMLIGTV